VTKSITIELPDDEDGDIRITYSADMGIEDWSDLKRAFGTLVEEKWGHFV
jgi:hypothetical protein